MPLQRTGRRGVSVLRLYASVAMADTMRPTCTNMAKVPPSKVHRGGAVAASTDSDKLPTSMMPSVVRQSRNIEKTKKALEKT